MLLKMDHKIVYVDKQHKDIVIVDMHVHVIHVHVIGYHYLGEIGSISEKSKTEMGQTDL